MKILFFLVFLGLHSAAAVTHSMKYFVTASSQVPNFPEYVAVRTFDGVQVEHYDSNTMKAVPKQDWVDEFPEYSLSWKWETDFHRDNQQVFKVNLKTLRERFNQTGGVHIVQEMHGCEWDNETGDFNGFYQYGYDGEDFISLDLKTLTWIAPKQQAVITKQKWERAGQGERWKNDIIQTCVEWLKEYVNYGRSSLMRTDLPSVSLLQKTPSSPVSCFATGFYPAKAEMFWRKDGEELHEDVELGEILPNHDRSFQMSVALNLSSVTPEDWRRYECVFQLSGVKDDIITKLDKAVIKSNEGFPLGAVVGVGVVLLLLVVGISGFFLWKNKKKGKEGFQPANTTGASSSSLSTSVEVQDTG
ncbi:BOLA class I histocompatibility antigen, alpha chain BL3-7-like [Scomber japonicus]|uniref:BOLA class I histocompatibility antigen, alpha chain BL3-7-like n=1 Tax=Scomber japonicus TaxID=13676 RepID=UPI002305EF54|nr:BOLA class I histocompatibility antigen, alpha chain BL3-7-like [Scomber japonicus]